MRIPTHVLLTTAIHLLVFTLTVDEATSQSTQHCSMTQFKTLLSSYGEPACAVVTTPYKSYTVDRLNRCTYDCKSLRRQTSDTIICVGFNYYDSNNTCQLFTSNQRLYFTVQSSCTYFVVSRNN